MGADLDFGNEETVQEVTSWLYWYINLTKINGLRLDAVKHIPASFYKNLLPKIYQILIKNYLRLVSIGTEMCII